MTKDGYISRPPINNARAAVRLGQWLLAMIVCGGIASGAIKPDPAAGRVKTVRFWSLGDVTRVAVEVSTKFTYSADHLSAPERLFFDIRGASPEMVHKGIRSMRVDDALVHQIRIAETQPRVTRVVLDLARDVTITTSELTNPNRLIIELHAKDPHTRTPNEAPAGHGEMTGGHDAAALTSSAKVSNTKGLNTKASSNEAGGEDVQGARLLEPPLGNLAPNAASNPASNLTASSLPASVSTTASGRSIPRKFQAPEHLVEPHLPSRPINVIEPEVHEPPVLLALGKPARIPEIPSAPMRDLPPPPAPSAPTALRSNVQPLLSGSLAPGEPTAAKINPGASSLTRVLGLKLGRIVLDPGHGGNDVGTHGPAGYLEKDLVLDVSRRLGALIEQRLGSEVIYTRSDDSYVALEERTHLANQRKADLFLSIHANSSPYRSATGVETYILNFTPARAANELAARENASSSSSVHDLRSLVEQIAAADKADESLAFATRIQYSLAGLPARGSDRSESSRESSRESSSRESSSRNDSSHNRGIKRAPFVVLIGAAMPSVLAEIGFLSNAEEETMLRKPEYRQRIAEALYKGVASYAETLSRFDVARKN